MNKHQKNLEKMSREQLIELVMKHEKSEMELKTY